jgi:aspartyl-tRNA(Asn)/glutamyl-tRNA(Gln) amidotransferase subunit B
VKLEEKKRREGLKLAPEASQRTNPIEPENDWELSVGIEIHAELDTERKLFSSAPTGLDAEPNSNVALFDLAYPGSQPVFQVATLLPAIRAALALNCEIQPRSSFDRKHYFYPDQPAGYQITQFYRESCCAIERHDLKILEPYAKDGHITLYARDGIAPEDGESVIVPIKQVQMEQDTAKSNARSSTETMLDFNRVSHPLIEIISYPDMHHPATAAAYVRKVQQILKSVGAVTAGMEVGGLRADVNVSIRKVVENGPTHPAPESLGQRTEIKNLISFKAIEDAISSEKARQIQVLNAGEKVVGETRGWTLGGRETYRLRGKEGEVDYRYMPDPDLGPLDISEVRLRQGSQLGSL